MVPEEQTYSQVSPPPALAEGESLNGLVWALAQLRPFSTLTLKISIELGRSTLKLSDLLELGYHSVVELDKPAGDNLDIFINGILLGRGEVVIIEDKVGIKINEFSDHSS
ncbi:MAG TPA: flagellar motor switch protein FliN [Terriglobia bacterium]|nr:flagellar motor switch protein FliN [Terriglobia bacterium]